MKPSQKIAAACAVAFSLATSPVLAQEMLDTDTATLPDAENSQTWALSEQARKDGFRMKGNVILKTVMAGYCPTKDHHIGVPVEVFILDKQDVRRIGETAMRRLYDTIERRLDMILEDLHKTALPLLVDGHGAEIMQSGLGNYFLAVEDFENVRMTARINYPLVPSNDGCIPKAEYTQGDYNVALFKVQMESQKLMEEEKKKMKGELLSQPSPMLPVAKTNISYRLLELPAGTTHIRPAI